MKARRRGRVILDRWQHSLDEYNADTIKREDSMVVIWSVRRPAVDGHWITVHTARYRPGGRITRLAA